MMGKLLSHTQVHTTERYAQLARESIQTAAARTTGGIGVQIVPHPKTWLVSHVSEVP